MVTRFSSSGTCGRTTCSLHTQRHTPPPDKARTTWETDRPIVLGAEVHASSTH